MLLLHLRLQVSYVRTHPHAIIVPKLYRKYLIMCMNRLEKYFHNAWLCIMPVFAHVIKWVACELLPYAAHS